MQLVGLSKAALLVTLYSGYCAAAPLESCSQEAHAFAPCEISFNWQDNEVPNGFSPYKDDPLHVEFRSPHATTYLMRGFWDGLHSLRVRFTPTEAGAWTYRVTSSIKRYDNQESSFTVAESTSPGFVSVANLRHWWTTNKQPHLWLAASVPFLDIDQSTLERWLDQRKRDGFTHIRGPLLTLSEPMKPLVDGIPNFAYFAALDDRILAAAERGFTVDLLLADSSFASSAWQSDSDQRDALVRYLVARYGGLNVTWQGIEKFEDYANSRTLLKDVNSSLQKYDAFHHPRSTDARASSYPLLADGWMDFLIESSPRPEVGAADHQFTTKPEIHVVTATDPETFRHELWNCTTNGEYPSVSYEALRNEANVKAVETWFKVVSDTRHWELEPYFDVSGARSVGLDEVEYLAYAEKPGIVEITLPKHKYNPVWVNPITGEESPLKDYKGDVFSQQTPDTAHDWVLQVPREGHKESMLRSYRFESVDPPIQEVETDPSKAPFEISAPAGDAINPAQQTPFKIKITRANRASRVMQFVWWGEVVGGSDGGRLLGVGSFGKFTFPRDLNAPGKSLNIRVLALNANGKAYEIDKVYQLSP